jgi:hypothetical protein
MTQQLVKRALLWAGLLLSATLPSQAGLIETYDFEDGGNKLSNYNEIDDDLDNPNVTAYIVNSTDIARRGTHSVKTLITNADKRAEVVSNKRGTVGGINWYGWSMYIPSTTVINHTRAIVSQFHDWHNSQPAWGKDNRAPSCFTLETNGNFQFNLKYENPAVPQTIIHQNFVLGAYTVGAWHDMVMQVRWTHLSTGFVKIWVNGELKLDYTGPTYMNYTATNSGPYFKAGDYTGLYDWTGVGPRYFHFDEFRMGNSTSSYAEVDPAPPIVDIQSEADAHVRPSSFQNTNYGSATTLNVRDDSNVKYDFQSYLRFDLSTYPHYVNSAKLVLSPAQLGTAIGTASFNFLLVANDTWGESTIVWANKPPGSTYLATLPGSGLAVNQPVEIDLTAIARAQKAADGKLSLVVIPMTLGSDRFANFHSHESTTGQAPLLRLE